MIFFYRNNSRQGATSTKDVNDLKIKIYNNVKNPEINKNKKSKT